MPPPPGVTPNFTDPYSSAAYNVIVNAVCLALVTVFVAMRLYAKTFITRALGIEDCEYFLDPWPTLVDNPQTLVSWHTCVSSSELFLPLTLASDPLHCLHSHRSRA